WRPRRGECSRGYRIAAGTVMHGPLGPRPPAVDVLRSRELSDGGGALLARRTYAAIADLRSPCRLRRARGAETGVGVAGDGRIPALSLTQSLGRIDPPRPVCGHVGPVNLGVGHLGDLGCLRCWCRA